MSGTALSGTGRKAILVLASQGLGATLGYVALLAIGRAIDPSAYGLYVFAFTAVGFLALVANLGAGAAHQRNVARGAPLERALGVFVRLRLALAAGAAALGLAAYGVWVGVLGRGLTDAVTLNLLLIAVGIHGLSGLRQVAIETWIAQGRIHRVEMVRTLDTAVSTLLVVAVAAAVAAASGRWTPWPGAAESLRHLLRLEAPFTAEAVALRLGWAYLTGKAASLALASSWWLGDGTRVGGWDPALGRATWKAAVPLAAAGAIGIVLQSTDVLVVGYAWTSREVGLYGAAMKVAAIALLAATTVSSLLFPRFNAMMSGGDHAAALATFRRAERYLLLVAVPMAVACVTVPRAVLHIAVGDGFLGAAGALRWLGAWTLVATLALPLHAKFLAAGAYGTMVRATGFNALLNLALDVVLVPAWGAGWGPTGAAVATAASGAASYLYLRARAGPAFGIPPVDRVQARILAAGLAVAAFWTAAWRLLGPAWWDRAWELAAWGLAGTALFAGLLTLLGELGREDWRLLRHLASPRGLWDELSGRGGRVRP